MAGNISIESFAAKTRGWYRANYSHFHSNKNWNFFFRYILLSSRSEFSSYLPSHTYFVGKDRVNSWKFLSERKANRSISNMFKFDEILFFFFQKKNYLSEKFVETFILLRKNIQTIIFRSIVKLFTRVSSGKKIFWKLYSFLEFEYLFVAWKKRRPAFGKLSFLPTCITCSFVDILITRCLVQRDCPSQLHFRERFRHHFTFLFCNVILIVKGSQVTRVFYV